MRASRLMALLFVLQRRRAATAAELAAELEVSERTIYRDVASLSEVGVPIWTEPGPGGGIRLVDGWRTRLDGLTSREAAAMLTLGAPQLLAELGLGTALAGAQAKILATLPEELRAHARVVAERVHLDAPGWFQNPAEVTHLAVLAEALWEQRRVRIAYGPHAGSRVGSASSASVHREVEPLGLVLKAGVWYLVAGVDGDVRTYRAARIAEAVPLDATFARPEDFDLPAWWAESAARFAAAMLREKVRIRVSPAGLRGLPHVTDPDAAHAAVAAAGEPDDDGWREVLLDVESLQVAAGQLVALGGEVEALEPPELRARLAEHGRALAERNAPLG
ncbi:transcriptional regulator [Pseudonocardia sp. RS11V-5]|uniref:helix-turn-helix transcriptional regulator n=1 Tax=Pseudonocardia terrae TaxID=2905831 RepID=UPI001E4452BA|nr:transcriptional regulator [Pseudonocardia terrae]MCE3553711.1 transcriptional regulator [Pseudonocardia terrae]